MKENIRLCFLAIVTCLSVSVTAQMNRSAQANNITSNIYQNTSHSITGAALQQVMLNQNNSYVNMLSDTNLLDVRIFSPYATYTPGMGAFYNDTLYMNVVTAHGAWTNSDWIKINGSSCACSTLVKYSDTGHTVATIHDISVATNPLIPWADTGIKIATLHSVAVSLNPYVPFSDTGLGSKKVATSYNLNSYSTFTGLHDSLQGYQQIKDSNTRGGYATTHYVSSHGGGLLAGDTIGGTAHIGTSTQIATNYSAAILGGQATSGAMVLGTTNNEPYEIMYNNNIVATIESSTFQWGYLASSAAGSITMGQFSSSTGTAGVTIGYNCAGNDSYDFIVGYADNIANNYSNVIALGANINYTVDHITSNMAQIGSKTSPVVLQYDSATSQVGGQVVAGSISGTAMFIQTQAGSHIKEVDVSLDTLHGTVNYTFPIPFTAVVDYILYTNVEPGITGISLSKTAVSITGGVTAPSGFIEIKGY